MVKDFQTLNYCILHDIVYIKNKVTMFQVLLKGHVSACIFYNLYNSLSDLMFISKYLDLLKAAF